MSLLTRTLCALFGPGHEWSLPKVQDGRYRLVCQFGCGAMSAGIQTKGMEQQAAQRTIRPMMNLLVMRSDERQRRIA